MSPKNERFAKGKKGHVTCLLGRSKSRTVDFLMPQF